MSTNVPLRELLLRGTDGGNAETGVSHSTGSRTGTVAQSTVVPGEVLPVNSVTVRLEAGGGDTVRGEIDVDTLAGTVIDWTSGCILEAVLELVDVLLVTASLVADTADSASVGAVVIVLLQPSKESSSPARTSAVLVGCTESIFLLLGLPDSPSNSE